jgi:GNAT superfamily N-acetyltransferase
VTRKDLWCEPEGPFRWREVTDHPPLELEIYSVPRDLWRVFSRHHYLSATINSSAQCFGAFVGDEIVAFSSYIHFPHASTKNIKIGHRTVVLPDYQGLGISGHLAEFIGAHLYVRGYRYRRVIAHPAVIAYCAKSPRWRDVSSRGKSKNITRWKAGSWKDDRTPIRRFQDPRALTTRSFEYTPPAEDGSP